MASRTSSNAFRYTALLADSAVTATERGKSTPAFSMEDKMRHVRSRIAVWVRSPTTGNFSMRASSLARPRGSLRIHMNPPTNTAMTPNSANHQCKMNADVDIMMRVTSGNFAPRDLKNTVNRGRTKIVSTRTVTTDITATTAG